jgi:hypothetical protein
MKSPTLAGSVRYASGEELLLLTVFYGPQAKRAVDRELDRRASLRRHAMRFRGSETLSPDTNTKRAA